MNIGQAMNSTLTRVQAFAVVTLSIILICGGLGVLLLWTLNQRVQEPRTLLPVVHGIETSWRSAEGAERVWSISGAGDYHPWLAEHIDVVAEAQRLAPREEKK